MRVILISRGGFTGAAGEERREVEVDELDPSDAGALRALVGAADLARLPARLRSASPKPWHFSYTLTVDDDGGARTVTFDDDSASDALRALVERVTELVEARQG